MNGKQKKNTASKVVLQAPTFEKAKQEIKKPVKLFPPYDVERAQREVDDWLERKSLHFGGKQYD